MIDAETISYLQRTGATDLEQASKCVLAIVTLVEAQTTGTFPSMEALTAPVSDFDNPTDALNTLRKLAINLHTLAEHLS